MVDEASAGVTNIISGGWQTDQICHQSEDDILADKHTTQTKIVWSTLIY